MLEDPPEPSPIGLPPAPGEAEVERRSLVLFHSAAGELAVDAAAVEEVVALGEVTSVPLLPGYVPGLVFQRGRGGRRTSQLDNLLGELELSDRATAA